MSSAPSLLLIPEAVQQDAFAPLTPKALRENTRRICTTPLWKRGLRLLLNPAVLVSVGYMDPGNWGTDLEAGARYNLGLLWVVVLASGMAIVLQMLAARLGIATGLDLAQASRKCYPKWTRVPNWLLSELAIAACDLAEVLGSAIAINLLFGLPLFDAVLITAADVVVLLTLQRSGMRTIEAIVCTLVLTILVCFAIELFLLPGAGARLSLVPSALLHPEVHGPAMVTAAVGIIGATVMPHNLYLHSALVTEHRGKTNAERRTALRRSAIQTISALGVACVINAAILFIAAVILYGRSGLMVDGHRLVFTEDTDWIRVAYLTAAPAVGAAIASTLFAFALLASGQSSTITGTMAGEIVMSGFLKWRIAPWKRRLITRLIAIIPAALVIGIAGNGRVTTLLVLSQVILALQLPFAMFPLLHLSSTRRFVGRWRAGSLLLALGWASAILITLFDLAGLPSAWADVRSVVMNPAS